MPHLLRIIQCRSPEGSRWLGLVTGERVANITLVDPELDRTTAAFRKARAAGRRLGEYLNQVIEEADTVPARDVYRELLETGQVLAPVDETPEHRILVSGTGLTHLGSMQQRDSMNKKGGETSPSRQMFEMGLEGGRPPENTRGAAPEWFYKGDGRILRGPGQPLHIPDFAPDGGEEPEVVVVYMVDDRGIPCRLGFTQGNEWSDHVTEKINYLYLAPSKLRACSIGPELVVDFPFEDVRGWCRVHRGSAVIYDSGELLTGESNMCHSLANLEDHHFKYPQHRCPGDVHVHFLGTSKLSFSERDWRYQSEDVVEVSFVGLGPALRNPVHRMEPSNQPVRVELG